MKSRKEKQVIGRRELVNLPELGLKNLDAKIDTGAYGCAIHCHKIRIKERNGIKYLYFDLLDPSHPQYEKKVLKSSKFSSKRVKNSFGESEKRYVIQSYIEIFGEEIEVELSLTDRSEMKYPVLIGREFIRNRFVVDVSKYNLSKKFLLKNKKPKPKKSKKTLNTKKTKKQKTQRKKQ